MNVEVEEIGPVERRLRVEIPTAEVDAAFDVVYRQMARTARIRGFRPGRVPRSVLERLLGDRARSEALERLIQDSLPSALKEAALSIVGEPRLSPDVEPKQGTPFVYEATVELRPEIELRAVRGLQVRRPELPETEEDPVESYLGELRESHAQLLEEPDGTAAARGRIAILDYEGTCEGRPFEGGSGREATLELGSGRAIPGFEEQIEGMTVGAERDIELDLPEAYPNPQLAGKQVRFHVKLLGLKRKELPDLDDEFAKDASEFDTLEAMRQDIRSKVDEGRASEAKRLLREEVAKKVLEENPFPVPPSLVDRQLGGRLARALGQLGRDVPEDRLRELVERWREEWRPHAEQEVRLALVVPEIARTEGLEVTDEEVDTKLRELAKHRGTTAVQLRRENRERGLVEGVRASLLEERVLEFLVSKATVSDA